MPEIYNKPYRPVGEAMFGHRIFVEKIIPALDLGVGAAYTDNDLVVNFQGWARQAWKVLLVNGGVSGPTAGVEIQEFLPDPGSPNDGDPANGQWATKGSLGVGTATADILFEHNGEDTLRLTRLLITPAVSVSTGGIKVVIEGRRDT
jgi:hypothetical protein